MSVTVHSNETILATLIETQWNITHAAKLLGHSRTCLQHRIKNNPGLARPEGVVRADLAFRRYRSDNMPGASGEEIQGPREATTLPAEAGVTRRVIMTAAQDSTPMLEPFLANLRAYAGKINADIFVGGFTYQKGLFEDHRVSSGVFAQSIKPFLRPDVVQLAPRLLWWGKANILPTAVDPLTGWETQTREATAVFPHAKIALKCVPTTFGRPQKQIMTTGVITRPNYIQRNAGQKAEFHHTPGAVLAEIMPDGTFFLRHLNMDKTGGFQDLDIVVQDEVITEGNRVEAITWGDIHYEEIDLDVADVLWGREREAGGMLSDLMPYYQFFHDSFSFRARSHHTRTDPHERAKRIEEREDSVREMLRDTAGFLGATQRPWCRSIHVASNHNQHLHSWLKDPAGHSDPVNALIWHRLNAAWFDAIEHGQGETFSAHIEGLTSAGADLSRITFLHTSQSYLICQDTAPIECGLHGDHGPRGSRGTPTGLAKLIERVNSAHTHEPQIRDGLYVAGTSSRLDIEYAIQSPGAWQHAEIVTYPNGKRTIVTLNNGKYRA